MRYPFRPIAHSSVQNIVEALTNSQIRKLKSMAQRMDATLSVGKAGLSDAFIKTLDDELERHELVKIRFGEFKEQKKELTPLMEEKTRSQAIMAVGHVVVLYRQQPDAAKRVVPV